MNSIARFRKCTLSNKELLEKVDRMTDGLFDAEQKSRRGQILVRHIPAQPNNDYDLLLGELILRFAEMEEACREVVKGYEGDGMEQMTERDKVFYEVCKKATEKKKKKYIELYDKIPKSKWFMDAYKGKSLGP